MCEGQFLGHKDTVKQLAPSLTWLGVDVMVQATALNQESTVLPSHGPQLRQICGDRWTTGDRLGCLSCSCRFKRFGPALIFASYPVLVESLHEDDKPKFDRDDQVDLQATSSQDSWSDHPR